MKPKVLVIVGPTAVGKTDLSLKLAKQYHGEIISGDSLQVYRHLDVGTAKVTPTERQQAPHFLIDIRDVDQPYSAFDFKQLATQKIEEITQRGHLPIIVGGTGLYIASLLKNFTLGGDADDQARLQIRHELEKELDQVGAQKMWAQLAQLDPNAAAKIPVQNSRRTIRALEVIRQTGQLFSEQEQAAQQFDAYLIGLNTSRESLYQRINQRVELMIEAGLVDEVKWLFTQVSTESQPAKGIGYREFPGYLSGKQTLARTIELIKQDSRHYAKRQLTYFRNQLPTNWFDLIEDPQALKTIKQEIELWLLK